MRELLGSLVLVLPTLIILYNTRLQDERHNIQAEQARNYEKF